MSGSLFPGLAATPVSLTAKPSAGDIAPLALSCEMQCRAHWCWAAICTEIGRIFGSTEPQERLAHRVQRSLFKDDAPAAADTHVPPCDRARPQGSEPIISLNKVLPTLDVPAAPLRCQPTAALSERDLLAELRDGRPVAIKIEWGDGSAHFIVVVGASMRQGTWLFTVDDPMKGRLDVSYVGLVRYQSPGDGQPGGRWTDSWWGIGR